MLFHVRRVLLCPRVLRVALSSVFVLWKDIYRDPTIC
jgi:hypothetical protein